MTVEDAGKYKVTAKNELGESNATISLNFDSKWTSRISKYFILPFENLPKKKKTKLDTLAALTCVLFNFITFIFFIIYFFFFVLLLISLPLRLRNVKIKVWNNKIWCLFGWKCTFTVFPPKKIMQRKCKNTKLIITRCSIGILKQKCYFC